MPRGLFRKLPESEKVAIFDEFVKQIDEIHKGYGTTMGTYQILDTFDEIAIEKGFVECPYCHRKGRQ